MRLRRLTACIAVLAASTSVARAGAWSSAAIVRMDAAAEEQSHEMQTAEAVLDLEVGAAFESGWSVNLKGRVRADASDRLEPGRPEQLERSRYNRRWLLSDTADAELRELYVDGHAGPVFVRVGKQQVVWGQADGVRVLDVVNPFSFREFIWPDPQDRRIGLWTVKTEVPFGPATLQLLWLPDPTYDELPSGDAAFAITTPLFIPPASGAPVDLRSPRRPSGIRDTSDAGARLSAFVGGWDLTLNYLYHRRDDPAPFVAIENGIAVIEPSYERSRLIGGSFSNAFGSTTLRGEIGYSTDRWFITTDPRDPDRLFASDEIAFVVGFDNTVLADTLVSVQYAQSTLRQPRTSMTRERSEEQMTFLVQRAFRNDSVRLRALWLRSLNRGDGGIQARLSWQPTSRLSIGVSVEHFYGDPAGLFGEFRDASRAGLDLQWSWARSH